MRYGHFDTEANEYVIDRPDTPRPWSNYLGDRHYGGIITNHAGGYSFFTSGGDGRHVRLRYNSVPLDQPGRYFYLRDRASGDHWSSTWQPVGKPLDQYRSTCRFGTAYAVIDSAYAGIETETTYLIPRGEAFEVWSMRITNTGDAPRSLSVFSFAEFACEWNMTNDLMNLQYAQFINEATCEDGLIEVSMCGRLDEDPDNFANRDQSRWWWMGQVGEPVVGFDTDRESFVGVYRGYDAPTAVTAGACTGSRCYGDNPCGALQSDIELGPGETTTVTVVLGVGKAADAGRAAMASYAEPSAVADAVDDLRRHYHAQLDTQRVSTPDAELDAMANCWNPYNALMTFNWSRSCSLVYTGAERDGFGFRDTVQDTLGVCGVIPEQCGPRLELMLTAQESTGGAKPVVRPWAHKPGSMTPTDAAAYRSDDCLWFFNTLPAYLAETGDFDLLTRVLPYSDAGEATVLGHLRRALEFNLERTGANGLPCGLSADWNDCLKLGYRGESVFVAMQLRLGLDVYADLAERVGEPDEAAWARGELETLDATIQRVAWREDRFVWAIAEDGTVFGKAGDAEGALYLNTQVWAVISGAATDAQRDACLDAVRRELETEHGVMLCAPPFENTSPAVMRAVLFQPGCKENAGIFCHTQSWAVMAEAMRGDGDAAYRMLRAFLPAAYNDRAEVRQIEPFVHCQSTHSKFSPKFGASRLPWLSGTAAWANYATNQWVLGVRPELDGLRIDPCIPRDWPGYTVHRTYRGMRLRIEVNNPSGVCRGVASLTVDGKAIDGNLVPVETLRNGGELVVTLG
jgi:cellobiose phosphorylase